MILFIFLKRSLGNGGMVNIKVFLLNCVHFQKLTYVGCYGRIPARHVKLKSELPPVLNDATAAMYYGK